MHFLVNIDGMNVNIFKEVYSHMNELPTYKYAHIYVYMYPKVYVLRCVDANGFMYGM